MTCVVPRTGRHFCSPYARRTGRPRLAPTRQAIHESPDQPFTGRPLDLLPDHAQRRFRTPESMNTNSSFVRYLPLSRQLLERGLFVNFSSDRTASLGRAIAAASAMLMWPAIALCSVDAVPYDMSWKVIADGGRTYSVGGLYRLGATVGQLDAAVSNGGSYRLTSGFWTMSTGPLLAVDGPAQTPLRFRLLPGAPNPFG